MLKTGISFIFDILQTVVLAIAIFIIIYLFAAQPNNIKGASMEVNFNDGDYILTEKVSYRLREPKRGEVIVFKAPNRPDVDYIKRIIAVPGEIVKIQDGSVYINDVKLDETYEPSSLQTTSGKFLSEGEAYTIPDSTYFVLGDNRPKSSDSREFGAISRNDIVGRAFWCYWPMSCFGKINVPIYAID